MKEPFVELAEITLDVRGMTCISCIVHVEGALTDLNGVTDASVNLRLGTARVTYIPGTVPVGAMKLALKEVGYEAQEHSSLDGFHQGKDPNTDLR